MALKWVRLDDGNHSWALPVGNRSKQTSGKTHTLVLPVNRALKVGCFNFKKLRLWGGGAKLFTTNEATW